MKADLELVHDVKNGDRSSFSELVRRHQKALLRMAMRMMRDLDLAEDVVQESFVKAFQKIHQFEEKSSFKSWIYRITVNTAKNKLRGNSRESMSLENVSISINAEAESGLVHQAIQLRLREEIDSLPTKQQTALVLRIYEEMSFKEIAQIMECPYDTAKANYRHALLKLKQSIQGEDGLKKWLNTMDVADETTVRTLAKLE